MNQTPPLASQRGMLKSHEEAQRLSRRSKDFGTKPSPHDIRARRHCERSVILPKRIFDRPAGADGQVCRAAAKAEQDEKGNPAFRCFSVPDYQMKTEKPAPPSTVKKTKK